MFTDLILATFPVFFLRKLQVSFRTKAALCFLMGLGVMYVPSFIFLFSLLNRFHLTNSHSTAACATVRTVFSGALTSPDESWDISQNVGWRLPEVNIGIVCANAPALRPLYLYLSGRLDTQRTRGQSVAVSDLKGSAGTKSGSRSGNRGGTGRGAAVITAPEHMKSLGSESEASGREKLVGAYAQFEGRERGDEEMGMGFTPPQLSPEMKAQGFH